MPFFLSLFLLAMIPPIYAVSPPSMDTPFVEHCTGEFAASAARSFENMFESETDQMLAALTFDSVGAFSKVTAREVCICFETAHAALNEPSSPLSVEDLWNTFLALERGDSEALDEIWVPLQSLPDVEKDRIKALTAEASEAMLACTRRRIQAVLDTSMLHGLNLQIGAAVGIIP